MSLPAPLMLAAVRAARGLDRGDTVELTLEHDVRSPYELPGVAPCAGEFKLRRALVFEATGDGGARFVEERVTVENERLTIGASVEDHPHESGCGHPRGCGDPCGWCAESEAHGKLRRRVASLLAAAAAGDADLCVRLIKGLQGP